MGYSTEELEKKSMMEMDIYELEKEANFLYEQYLSKIKFLQNYGLDLYCRIEPKLTFEMIKGDLELIVERHKKVNDEYKRRSNLA